MRTAWDTSSLACEPLLANPTVVGRRKALSLTIPPSLPVRADQVIE